MKNRLLRIALDALDIPAPSHNRSVTPHKPRGGAIARVPGGELVELLGEVPTMCPHCHKPIPRPQTRRRRLVQVVAGGRVLATEID